MFNQIFQRGNRCPPGPCRAAGTVPAALSGVLRGAQTRAVDALVDRALSAGSGAVPASGVRDGPVSRARSVGAHRGDLCTLRHRVPATARQRAALFGGGCDHRDRPALGGPSGTGSGPDDDPLSCESLARVASGTGKRSAGRNPAWPRPFQGRGSTAARPCPSARLGRKSKPCSPWPQATVPVICASARSYCCSRCMACVPARCGSCAWKISTGKRNCCVRGVRRRAARRCTRSPSSSATAR